MRARSGKEVWRKFFTNRSHEDYYLSEFVKRRNPPVRFLCVMILDAHDLPNVFFYSQSQGDASAFSPIFSPQSERLWQ